GKVKALLETTRQDTQDDWSRLQEEMMSILRMANPAKLRARIISLGREYPVDQLINHVYLPVRQRLVLDHNTSRIMSSMFDGALIEYAAASLFEMRRKPGKEAILMAWNVEERARLWLEAWRLSLSGWHISVLADPIESPRPELFPTQTLIVWTGMAPTRRQNELLQHWGEQGYKVIFHAP
ncbi:DNA-binding transcriptional repressor BluR, partial [Escherichia coli]